MIKKFVFGWFVLLVIVSMFSCSSMPAASSGECGYISNPSGFEIRRGVNLSHWLSQCTDWAVKDKFITREDIRLIKSFGFDHVRIPIDEEVLWHEDGTVNEVNLTYLKNCLTWCTQLDMRAVVDLHILRSHHFNVQNNEGKMTLWADPAAQDTFIKLWENLSDYLRDYPNDRVAYELMNEPVAPDHEQWNVLINRAFKIIRKREPERVIIFGSNRWQIPSTFPYLKVPRGDKNIILSCHTYDPLFVTHYLAPWSGTRFYTGPVQYPGQSIKDEDFEKYVDKDNEQLMRLVEDLQAREVFNKEKLQEVLQPAIDKAKELDLQLYCNEFGCLPNIPRDMRLRYYQDITDVFRENCMAFANWDYKGSFQIVGWDMDKLKNLEPDTELIKILTK